MFRPKSSAPSASGIGALPMAATSSSSISSSLPTYSSLMENKLNSNGNDHGNGADDDVNCMIPLPALTNGVATDVTTDNNNNGIAMSRSRVATVKRLGSPVVATSSSATEDDHERTGLLSVDDSSTQSSSTSSSVSLSSIPTTDPQQKLFLASLAATIAPPPDPSEENDDHVPDHIKKHPYYKHPHLGHLVGNPAALAAMGYAVPEDPELEEGRFGEGKAAAYHPHLFPNNSNGTMNQPMQMFGDQMMPRQAGDDIWCQFCQLMKPMRSKHCHKCKRCVVKFDHHCPFLGNSSFHHYHYWYNDGDAACSG
jgi:hypothetical protein